MSVSWSLLVLPLVECLVMGAAAGAVGALAVASRRVFLAEALTHATFPGAVVGVVVASQVGGLLGGGRVGFTALSLALVVGAALACLPMVALTRWLSGVPGLSSQAAAGAVLSLGFGGGYLLSRWFAPLPLKVDGFLAGSVLNVGWTDVVLAGAVAVLVLLVQVLVGHRIAAVAFDPLGYRAGGLSVGAVDVVVMVLVCLTVAALVPAVGTVLPIALLAAPAASAWPGARSVPSLVRRSALLGAVVCVVGLLLAVRLELSAGGVIGVLCGAVLGASRIRKG